LMRLLLIHTAGAEGTVALAEASDFGAEARVVATAVLPGRSASERLVAEVRWLMEAAGWRLAELAAVVVVHGPGSFTGVRVGLSASKGLCEAGGVALIAVSRLALLAEAAGVDGMVHAVLDAGRGEFYYGAYEGGVCLRESLLSRDEVVAAVASGGVVMACEGKVAEALVGMDVRLVDEPLAEATVGIALRRLGRRDLDDVASVDANYLRRTDFEIKAKLALRAAELGGGTAG
jgi:tRNA threonylcarbamoyladenosine biosynthesis protein TsaB